MQRNIDVLTIFGAVDADLVEIIAVGQGGCRCELDRQNLALTSRNHPLFVEFNFEKVGLSGKYVKSLRGWGNIQNIYFEGVGLVRFKARKFYSSWLYEEYTVRSYKLILCPVKRQPSLCFGTG